MIVNNNLYICNMEIYKDIKGFEGRYQVSNLGNVKSLGRTTKILKPAKDGAGYYFIILGKNKIKYKIHRLVAEVFISNPHNKKEVNHIDYNKTNNQVENLEWCTRSENVIHAANNGLMSRIGTNNGRSKLTKEQVLEIRVSNLSSRKLAEQYSLTKSTILRIKNKQLWKHI